MIVENECMIIYKKFHHRPFTFPMLEQLRKDRNEKPYLQKEKIWIVSYLQRNYGARKSYRNTSEGFLTVLTIPKRK